MKPFFKIDDNSKECRPRNTVGMTLNAENLTLVKFTAEMLSQEYIDWLNDREIMQYSNQQFLDHTRRSCLDYIASFDQVDDFLWGIFVDDDFQKCVGSISTHINRTHNTADVGIFVGDSGVRGTGVGTKAWIAVCEFLLKECDVRKVCGGALATNRSMIKIFKKAGMQKDGRRVQHHLCNGEAVDLLHYCLFQKGE